MSQPLLSQSQPQETNPVLTASVRDVRFFTALLKGINFSNRASVTLTADAGMGMIVTVEEARCLLATSYIYRDHFDEWSYSPDRSRPENSQPAQNTPDRDPDSTTFEIPLTTLIECLGVFGTANMSSYSNAPKPKKWRREDDASDEERGDVKGKGRGVPSNNRQQANAVHGLEHFFGGGNEKRTSMRLSYAGPGYPLTLLLAEDSSGPTTICEITTFDPEPNIDLPFDGDQTVLKIIFKSSLWLRDALSELDPSCEKITFIGNPAADIARSAEQRRESAGGTASISKPLFRIKASGDFGSTEGGLGDFRMFAARIGQVKRLIPPWGVYSYPDDAGWLHSYRFAHIAHTIRALQSSTKTSLRIEAEGLLSLQFLVPVPKARGGGTSDSFIEFRCVPLDDEVA
ncbi:Rad1/Rec1/Rad17 [Lanmaoa asiatica]|nr:Rad1/Rec1/Rad17 [Lanmaoa asiatica]